ncbi:phosphatidylinositol-4- kinase [Serendipita sp. 398]|nr:phosphatidylinositol-4- kinase [Serendipita sp. 398]
MWSRAVQTAWDVNPAVAVQMVERFKNVQQHVQNVIRSHPEQVLHVPEALHFLLGHRLDPNIRRSLKFLHLWDPVPPVMAITYFSPAYGNDSIVLQYAHRVLEQHPVNLTFFFVPQVVQALRDDALGYVERFIFETAKISQLFCHQIIWNMKANCYKDDVGEIEDDMKPTLDRITDAIVQSLSGEAREFYDREFGFFNEVTSISGKLKPFITRSKPEKKAKIDEEMAKIVVEVGVYLPSNPDGKVIDIDKKSGRPLQSHAKAPFMATFKVRKERIEICTDPNAVVDPSAEGNALRTEYDTWVQAIFKVGDDCRQDVLALQVIAMFKNSFTAVGLTLFLLPYRVIATGPGMGVIDVVPNSTSRDEMGRAKINDLLAFFVAKFGSEDTVAFQKARLNFIQSMAAYSVACYILQIKDRHNGNIMIDGHGHIAVRSLPPGGVKFEPNSFKLNKEMIMVMGGRNSEGFALFTRLTIKAFLAVRPHAEQIIDTIQLMLGSGLPSFKGEQTIRRLRDRFALHLNERGAADWMAAIVRNAYENMRSTLYDEFQRVCLYPSYVPLNRSNAIPFLAPKRYPSCLKNLTLQALKGRLTYTIVVIRSIILLFHACPASARFCIYNKQAAPNRIRPRLSTTSTSLSCVTQGPMSSLYRSLRAASTSVILTTAHYPGTTFSPSSPDNKTNVIIDLRSEIAQVVLTLQSAIDALQQHPLERASVDDAIMELARVMDNTPGVAWTQSAGIGSICDEILISLLVQLSWRVEGRVAIPLNLTPMDPFSTANLVQRAENMAFLAELRGVAKGRILMSIPATWEGIEAAKELRKQEIECNMTMVVSTAQAIACAQNGLARISPPISAIKKWHDQHNDSPFYDPESPACHPGIIFVKRMVDIFNTRNYTTAITPEDFETVEEATALAGIHYLCLSPRILEQLDATEGLVVNALDQTRGISLERDQNSLPLHSHTYNTKASFELAIGKEDPNVNIAQLLPELLNRHLGQVEKMRRIAEPLILTNHNRGCLKRVIWENN